jgi:hypothetical protein
MPPDPDTGRIFMEKTKYRYLIKSDQEKRQPQPPLEVPPDPEKPVLTSRNSAGDRKFQCDCVPGYRSNFIALQDITRKDFPFVWYPEKNKGGALFE